MHQPGEPVIGGKMKSEILVTVFKEDCNYDLPTKPDEFIAFFEEKIALVPNEYRDSARVEVEADIYYDSTKLNVMVSYKRLETDEEENARLKREKEQKAWKENQELCQLEKLKEKYGV